MEKTLKVLNDLEKEGFVKKYALGGATALLFYAEPALTYDLDVFIFLSETRVKKSYLVDLGPLYHALQRKGYRADKEHVMIEGIPVQFLPVYNSLVEEAVEEALSKDYQGVHTKVVSIEYLVAIMLKTNRPKDRERIGKLLEEGVKIKQDKLLRILFRHKLKEKWEKIIGKAQ